MPGRRRTRRAEVLAFNMLRDLHEHGPMPIDKLLDRQLSGPVLWMLMEPWEQAAVRMAIRALLRDYHVRLDIHGRLYPPPRQRRRAA